MCLTEQTKNPNPGVRGTKFLSSPFTPYSHPHPRFKTVFLQTIILNTAIQLGDIYIFELLWQSHYH